MSLTVDVRLVELLQVFGVAKLVHVLVDEVFGRYVHNVGDPVHQTTPSMSLRNKRAHSLGCVYLAFFSRLTSEEVHIRVIS